MEWNGVKRIRRVRALRTLARYSDDSIRRSFVRSIDSPRVVSRDARLRSFRATTESARQRKGKTARRVREGIFVVFTDLRFSKR